MFDIGFWELVVCGVVALIVLGPEQLPVVARKAGFWIGRIRRFVDVAKQDIDRELRLREVRDAIERHANLDEIKKIIDTERYRIEDEFKKPETEYVVKAQPDPPTTPPVATPEQLVDENLQYGHKEHLIDPMDALAEPVQHENRGTPNSAEKSAVVAQSDQSEKLDEHGKPTGG